MLHHLAVLSSPPRTWTRLVGLLGCCAVLCIACGGGAHAPEVASSAVAAPTLPKRIAIAPLQGIPVADAARLWAWAAEAAEAHDVRVVRDLTAAQVFLKLQGYRRGAARGREDAAGW